MKLIINYDFFDAIKDVKEPLGPLKIIRTNKKLYTMVDLPMYIAVSYYLKSDAFQFITSLMRFYFLIVSFDLGRTYIDYFFEKKYFGTELDHFGEAAKRRLSFLPSQLSDINVRTNYDKLLESQLYARKYKVQLNEDKIPSLIEKKFVLVPSYNFGGEETETSIMQEHVVGSHEYVLSVDEYKQEKRRVLVPNNS